MKVLVLGAGGREHALCWKLKQSPALTALYCAPGNPGTAQLATNLNVRAEDPDAVVAACLAHGIELVVVGPEAPLVAGVADAVKRAGVDVFGPSQGAARIEGSKAFAKDVMSQAGVPTAAFKTFTDAQQAEQWARAHAPIVIKADGLAAGKGVVVAVTPDEAALGVRECAALGAAAATLLLEERLSGDEVSVIALCDGERYVLLPSARDHKRVGDGDTGANTGGMGAFSPAPGLDDAFLVRVGEEVIAPTLQELAKRGTPFQGALFAGLMLTPDGYRVLEFNCRLGDPETQVLLTLLEEDLLPLLVSCARGTLQPRPLRLRPGVAVGVVAASHGYPQRPRLADPITVGQLADAVLFHAGTKLQDGALVTSGGRVLTATAHGPDFQTARQRAYAALGRVSFAGMHFRRDIGGRS